MISDQGWSCRNIMRSWNKELKWKRLRPAARAAATPPSLASPGEQRLQQDLLSSPSLVQDFAGLQPSEPTFPSSVSFPFQKALAKELHFSKETPADLSQLWRWNAGVPPGAAPQPEISPKLARFGWKPPSPGGAAGRAELVTAGCRPTGPRSPPQAPRTPLPFTTPRAASGDVRVWARAGESCKSGPPSPVCAPQGPPQFCWHPLVTTQPPQLRWPRQ